MEVTSRKLTLIVCLSALKPQSPLGDSSSTTCEEHPKFKLALGTRCSPHPRSHQHSHEDSVAQRLMEPPADDAPERRAQESNKRGRALDN